MKQINKILIIRFRQIGDSILAAAMCSSIKRSFPNAEIHIVLNERISPIFNEHPDIDKVISFTDEENQNFFKYLKKIWSVVNKNRYDVIIDMRSTIRTLIFSLFSLRTPIRIGRKKSYTFLLNRTIPPCSDTFDMVYDNQRFADALNDISKIIPVRDFNLYVTEKEKREFRDYMTEKGVDFNFPVILLGVTTKLKHKKWNIEYMLEIVKRILDKNKELQLIFNYAPGEEEREARNLYKALGEPKAIKIDIRARSIREFMALSSNIQFYFGNEGGARHAIQALGIPSYAIFSPGGKKSRWLIQNSTPAHGIDAYDILTPEQLKEMTYDEQFQSITPDIVWQQLSPYLDKL